MSRATQAGEKPAPDTQNSPTGPATGAEQTPGRPPAAARRRGRWVGAGLMAVVVALIPLATDNSFYLDVIIGILLLAAAGGAWNLLGGYAGQISLGHAAFFGVGGYTSVLLFTRLDITPWIGVPVGGLLAGLVGLAIGALTLRLRGPFFVLASIAFAQVLLILAIHLDWLTGGSPGVSVPFEPGVANMVFDSRGAYVWLIGGFAVLVFAVTTWLDRHRLGFQAKAVRENIEAAEALGIHGTRVKLQMTVLSAVLTGIVGGLSAFYIAFIDPDSSFGIARSIDFVLVAIIGGMGTVWGPLVGAILVELLHVELSGALGGGGAGLYLVVYGVLMIIVVLFFPRGIVGGIESLKRRFRRSSEGRRRV
jgi:branched-chain amino acid transport system permease protein